MLHSFLNVYSGFSLNFFEFLGWTMFSPRTRPLPVQSPLLVTFTEYTNYVLHSM